MSNSILSWDGLTNATKKSIEKYYSNLWQDSVIALLQESKINQDSLNEIYLGSKREFKRCGIDFGYVCLDWNFDPDSNQVKMWSGKFASLDPGAKITKEMKEEEKAIIDHVCLCKARDLIPVISIHCPTQVYVEGIKILCPTKDGNLKTLIVDRFPGSGIFTAIDPFLFDEVKEREASREKAAKIKKTLELQKEDDLYDWLRLQGIDVERQVKTSEGHRLDMWIPDKMIIEVKRGAVSGNDVCQCIEYAAEYSVSIVLIGDKLTTSASRGLHGFNKLHPKKKISFISWDTAFDYLRGRLANQ